MTMTTQKKGKPKVKFHWVPTAILRSNAEFGKWKEAQFRKELPEGVYWIRPYGARRVLWNLPLVLSYAFDGPNSDRHQRLLEEFAVNQDGVA